MPAQLGCHAAPQYGALPVYAPARAYAHVPSRPMWPGVGHSEVRGGGGIVVFAAHPLSLPAPGGGGCPWGTRVPLPARGDGLPWRQFTEASSHLRGLLTEL